MRRSNGRKPIFNESGSQSGDDNRSIQSFDLTQNKGSKSNSKYMLDTERENKDSSNENSLHSLPKHKEKKKESSNRSCIKHTLIFFAGVIVGAIIIISIMYTVLNDRINNCESLLNAKSLQLNNCTNAEVANLTAELTNLTTDLEECNSVLDSTSSQYNGCLKNFLDCSVTSFGKINELKDEITKNSEKCQSSLTNLCNTVANSPCSSVAQPYCT
jgi:hypothetical protein